MTAPLAAVDFAGPVTDGFRTLATFVPRLLGFLVILLVGYVVARVVSTLVDKGLEKAGFDRAVEKGGIKKALQGSSYDASDIVSKLVFFAVFVPFLSAAVGALGIAALQAPLAQFISLIPQLIVGIVLVVLGAVLAGAVKSFVMGTIGGLSYGRVLANVAGGLVLVLFVKSALDQVGVATTVTGPLLYTVLGTVAGVLVVGAGGGLIKPMQHRWETMLNKAEVEAQEVKARAMAEQARQQSAPAAPQYAQPATATVPQPYPTDPAFQQQVTQQQQYGQQ